MLVKSNNINNGHNNDNNDNSKIQLSPIILNEDYRKKWNITQNDFYLITKNGVPIRNTLYCVAHFQSKDISNKRYFILLKQVESYYSDEIMKSCKSRGIKQTNRYLSDNDCILDQFGNEKICHDRKNLFGYANLLNNDSIIYRVQENYYNIETNEFYCSSSSCMESNKYLYLSNLYDKDKSKLGVWKINKLDGTYEIDRLNDE